MIYQRLLYTWDLALDIKLVMFVTTGKTRSLFHPVCYSVFFLLRLGFIQLGIPSIYLNDLEGCRHLLNNFSIVGTKVPV